MRRWLLVVSLFLLASISRADAMRGTWHISQGDHHLQLNLTRDHSQMGHSMDPADFRGLSAEQMNASSETPVHFQMVREAGTFDFSGSFLNGDGVGRFAFTADPQYASRLRSYGVDPGELNDQRLYELAALDVSSSFIREMQSLGYRDEPLDRYVEFRIHGATPEFVRAMDSLGYSHLSADRLVEFRIHGVSPDFVREMKAAGYDNLSADRLVEFRIHGVNAQFARDMRDLGVRDLSPDQLVAMRIHGVTAAYVRELADLGYKNLPSDDLIAMRIHGVSTKFIRELADAGYHNIPVDKLVEMRIHGIDADFAKRVK